MSTEPEDGAERAVTHVAASLTLHEPVLVVVHGWDDEAPGAHRAAR